MPPGSVAVTITDVSPGAAPVITTVLPAAEAVAPPALEDTAAIVSGSPLGSWKHATTLADSPTWTSCCGSAPHATGGSGLSQDVTTDATSSAVRVAKVLLVAVVPSSTRVTVCVRCVHDSQKIEWIVESPVHHFRCAIASSARLLIVSVGSSRERGNFSSPVGSLGAWSSPGTPGIALTAVAGPRARLISAGPHAAPRVARAVCPRGCLPGLGCLPGPGYPGQALPKNPRRTYLCWPAILPKDPRSNPRGIPTDRRR